MRLSLPVSIHHPFPRPILLTILVVHNVETVGQRINVFHEMTLSSKRCSYFVMGKANCSASAAFTRMSNNFLLKNKNPYWQMYVLEVFRTYGPFVSLPYLYLFFQRTAVEYEYFWSLRRYPIGADPNKSSNRRELVKTVLTPLNIDGRTEARSTDEWISVDNIDRHSLSHKPETLST